MEIKKYVFFLKLYFLYTNKQYAFVKHTVYFYYNILVIETEPEYKSFGTNLISISEVLINL